MNWKECGRKQLWPNLRYYPGFCLERLRETIKALVRIAGLQAEVLIQDLSNTMPTWL
jgi:hypothetical protein